MSCGFLRYIIHNYLILKVKVILLLLAIFSFLLVLTVFSTFLVVNNNKLDKASTGLFNVGVIAIICWFLRIFTRVAERPSFYFLFFSCALMGYSMTVVKNKRDRRVIQVIVILICSAYYAYRFATSLSTLVPYQFYFI